MNKSLDTYIAADYIRFNDEDQKKRRTPILVQVDVCELTVHQEARVKMAISKMMRKAKQIGKVQLITLMMQPDGTIGYTESNSITDVKD